MEQNRLMLCPSCEASVSYDMEECPYCGHDLSKEQLDSLTETESLAALYEPPYSAQSTSKYSIPIAQEEDFTAPSVDESPKKTKKTATQEGEESAKSIVFTMTLLTVGAWLVTLGLLIFFFSENGRLVLEWKSRYCLLYSFAGIPFFYLGWLRLKA